MVRPVLCKHNHDGFFFFSSVLYVPAQKTINVASRKLREGRITKEKGTEMFEREGGRKRKR